MIRPHLEYGHSIWFPQLIRQSKKIENVQRRATKLIPFFKNLSYIERLRRLCLPSLKYRRTRGDMIKVFKYLSSEDKMGSCQLLPRNESCYHTRGHDKKLKKNRYNCNLRKFSFQLRVTNLWNSLTTKTTNATSINMFKKSLDDELKHLQYEID